MMVKDLAIPIRPENQLRAWTCLAKGQNPAGEYSNWTSPRAWSQPPLGAAVRPSVDPQ